ncbi:MAG: enoyl-CoA hydratase/isomerase family protein [Parvularculaceae bacterium]
MAEEILFDQTGEWGVVTLNRPQALNALTWDMVKAMRARVGRWARDPSIGAVLVKGEGGKAFCAGGDIRWLHDEAKKDPVRACEFFREEYRNNAAIFHFPKPYVSLIDGVVMGGGVGLSVHGRYCVAGDATLWAMPETGIGLFPDVGGGYFMPRLLDGLGLYLALTGRRLKAADCLYAEVATHYVPTTKRAALEKALLSEEFAGGADDAIRHVLNVYAEDPPEAPSLAASHADIDQLFARHDTLDGVMTALARDGGAFAAETLATLAKMSPASMRITFEQFKRGAALSFDETMKMEFRIVRRVMEGHDFFEGVRAQIIDKDRSPKWQPATLTDVADADAARYFAPLGVDELMLP